MPNVSHPRFCGTRARATLRPGLTTVTGELETA
jgi:hypothetical protein